MTKTNPKLNALVRTITGKKVRNLRKQGIMPSSIYGHGFDPISIQLVDKEMFAVFSHAGESSLVDLELDGKILPILFRNPQYHPVTGMLSHIDCYKVNLKEKITTFVPLEFIGESDAVKAGKVLVEAVNEVEVEALPANLPEKIEVDLSKLVDIDSEITVADLIFDRNLIEIKNESSQVVVKVEEPKVEEVVEVAPEAESTEPVVAPAMNQKTPEQKAADDAADAAEKKKAKEDK
jgi:large subunit ribosomal protein L25